MQRKDWAARVDGLVVFRGLLQSEPLASLRAALAADAAGLTGAVAAFESALFTQGTNWTEVLLDAVLENDNICIRRAASGGAGQAAEQALSAELTVLQQAGEQGLDELLADGVGMLAALLAAGNLSFWLCDRALAALTRYYHVILKPKLKKKF